MRPLRVDTRKNTGFETTLRGRIPFFGAKRGLNQHQADQWERDKGEGCMLGTELLETLLASYAECYDIQRDYPIQDAVYPAYAKFNVTSAKYVLMKKAELWRVNCFEHAFFSVVSSLQTEDLQKLRRQITEYMEPQLVRSGAKYPPPNHMYTFLTAIFISEGRVSPEVKKEAQRFRYFKNYLASIRGYSEARLLVFDLEAGEIFGNRAAKEMVKGYRKAGILKKEKNWNLGRNLK